MYLSAERHADSQYIEIIRIVKVSEQKEYRRQGHHREPVQVETGM